MNNAHPHSTPGAIPLPEAETKLAGPVTITIHTAANVNILCIISAPATGQPQPATAGAPKSREGV